MVDVLSQNLFLPEKIVISGQAFYQGVCMDIDRAQASVDLEMYIFDDDIAGRMVAQSLIAASTRGVRVRAHVDGVGSNQWGGRLAQELVAAGVQVRIFHPLPWHFWKWRDPVRSRFWFEKIFVLLTKINRRNHRKMVIIDKKLAWVGSFNISAQHLPKIQGGADWRDTAVRIADDRVSDLVLAFRREWSHAYLARFLTKRPRFPRLVRINNTRKARNRLYRELLKRVGTCGKRLWVTSAYFIPEYRLLRQILDAARRGVDVRILLPMQADVRFMTWSARSFYTQLLDAGVKIFEYSPAVLHAKVLIIDDWVSVGSSNMNFRSLFHDLEVDLVIRDENAQRELTEQFAADLQRSESIESGGSRNSIFFLWLGKVILLLRVFL